MTSAVRRILVATLLAVGIAAVASAAAPDPVIGSWKLNTAKSTFKSGTPPSAQTRVYTQTDKGISLTMKNTVGGKETTTTTAYSFDGKDYPVTGNPDWDMITAKQVDANKAEFTFKRGGKVVGTTTRTVSKDGKTLTATADYTDAKGAKVDNSMVFDKQ
jgi:hypothetical protein